MCLNLALATSTCQTRQIGDIDPVNCSCISTNFCVYSSVCADKSLDPAFIGIDSSRLCIEYAVLSNGSIFNAGKRIIRNYRYFIFLLTLLTYYLGSISELKSDYCILGNQIFSRNSSTTSLQG